LWKATDQLHRQSNECKKDIGNLFTAEEIGITKKKKVK
jgi:hypothetical protein